MEALLSESIKSSLLQWFNCRVDEAMSLVLRYLFLDTRWKFDVVDRPLTRRRQSGVCDVALDRDSGFLFVLLENGDVDVLSERGQRLWSLLHCGIHQNNIAVHAGRKALLLTGRSSPAITLVSATGKVVDLWGSSWWSAGNVVNFWGPSRWVAGQCVVGGNITYVEDLASSCIRCFNEDGTVLDKVLVPHWDFRTFVLLGQTQIALEDPKGISFYSTVDFSFLRRVTTSRGWRQVLFDGTDFVGAQRAGDQRFSIYSQNTYRPLASRVGNANGLVWGCRRRAPDGLDSVYFWDRDGLRALESSDLDLAISIF